MARTKMTKRAGPLIWISTELRLEIYKYLLFDKRPVRLENGFISKLPAIAAVCKQFRREVADAARPFAVPKFRVLGQIDPLALFANHDVSAMVQPHAANKNMVVHYTLACDRISTPGHLNGSIASPESVAALATLMMHLGSTELLAVEIKIADRPGDAHVRYEQRSRFALRNELLANFNVRIEELPNILEYSIRIDGRFGMWRRRESVSVGWLPYFSRALATWDEDISMWGPCIGYGHSMWLFGGRKQWDEMLATLQITTDRPVTKLRHSHVKNREACRPLALERGGIEVVDLTAEEELDEYDSPDENDEDTTSNYEEESSDESDEEFEAPPAKKRCRKHV